jgi:hypothetical protein
MAILFSAYRLDQYSDPEGFKTNIGLVLEQYPIDTIKFVTDPGTGIQRRCTFPPSVKEVVDACDSHLNHLANVDRFKNWGKRDVALLEAPREDKPTLDELKAKYGPSWGLNVGNDRVGTEAKPAPTWQRIAEQYHGDTNAMKRLTAPWMTRDGEKIIHEPGDSE